MPTVNPQNRQALFNSIMLIFKSYHTIYTFATKIIKGNSEIIIRTKPGANLWRRFAVLPANLVNRLSGVSLLRKPHTAPYNPA